ncbi:type II toxin-antitoxin system RelB/DinJ family antitoxin [Desulfobotulus mexicanus]|uniref:Type II toxin-antitoxin system RelB/DinJ family antitoxin n=1 Tax=Desulfobotulus mexicanus TaxID=2586642 RepID=A0A5S5MCG5_9BACT|nr:type II toxin-antitoxin system RelB/DinJ family antitoxin [Desulfobotulus mexicanus]TYT73418.1 type II toxin-antitoxin system RelB/DinJ family antitoxin [Desulfobotulus mexicanus]
MASVQVKVDDQLRARAQAVAADMGLDLASAIRMFLAQMVRVNGLPFQPYADPDPFYNVKNQSHLADVAADLKQGKNCSARDLIKD